MFRAKLLSDEHAVCHEPLSLPALLPTNPPILRHKFVSLRTGWRGWWSKIHLGPTPIGEQLSCGTKCYYAYAVPAYGVMALSTRLAAQCYQAGGWALGDYPRILMLAEFEPISKMYCPREYLSMMRLRMLSCRSLAWAIAKRLRKHEESKGGVLHVSKRIWANCRSSFTYPIQLCTLV